MSRYFNLYRVAAVLLVLFDLGHTLGGVLLHRSSGPAEDAVVEVMRSTHFTFNGADVTYWGFHTGYGLSTTVYLALSAYLAWILGRPGAPVSLRPVAWGLFVAQSIGAVLSFRYFFAGPGVFGCLIALALGVRCVFPKPGVA